MNPAVFIHAGIDVFQPFVLLLRIVEVFGKGMPPRFLAGPEVGNEDLADCQSFFEFIDEEQFVVIAGTTLSAKSMSWSIFSSASANWRSLY